MITKPVSLISIIKLLDQMQILKTMTKRIQMPGEEATKVKESSYQECPTIRKTPWMLRES
jgi:hypothetical protein